MKLQLSAILLFVIVMVGGAVALGVVAHTQVERDAVSGLWLLGIALTLVLYFATVLRFRQAAYRERAAGYTTIYGDAATIDLLPGRGPSVSIMMFSTVDLWQLDDKTGAVIRRPGERLD